MEPKTIIFQVDYEGKPDEQVELMAYAFSQHGELLDAAPLKEGMFQFGMEPGMLKHARVLIAPTREDREEQPGLDQLEQAHAYEPVINWRELRENQGRFVLKPIPEILWKWWPRCRCRVRGRVVRPVTIQGVTHQMPVCHARVHICEVDRWPRILWRIPDRDIFRLRDDLLQLAEVRIPRIPMPDPPPDFQFDPAILDVTPQALAALNRPSIGGFDPQPDPPHVHDLVALNPQPEPPGIAARIGDAVMLNPQPLPPKIVLDQQLQLELSTGSATLLRDTLVKRLDLLRPWLCWLPWLRYWYRCDQVAVVYTDNQGRFDTTISYPCFGDHPDLYFWVEYCIGGTWTTIYHPPIACNTYWNYACGTEVTITISDPRVPWCNDPSPLPGLQLAVVSIGHAVSTSEIQLSAAGSAYGLTSDGRPFGGNLEPHVWFGSGMIPAGIDHYRWSYRRLGTSGDWTAMDRLVVRHYAEIAADNTLTFVPFPLGPDPAFPSQVLFKIQPENSPGDSWAPQIDARENTASAFFESHKLNGGNAVLGAGKYELKLELFRSDGTLVNLTDAGILVKEAIDPAPFGAGSVNTALAPNERLILDGAGKAVAYRIILHIDNNPCDGQILPVLGSGVAIDADCGFYEYGPGASVTMRFLASHPNGFATFDFSTIRGLSHTVEAASANGPVSIASVNGFNRAGTQFTKVGIPVVGAEGIGMLEDSGCDRAAFGSYLHVNALATDGWSELDYLDRHATPIAFALVPVE